MGKSLKYGEFTFSSDPVGGSKGYARGGACKPMAKANGGSVQMPTQSDLEKRLMSTQSEMRPGLGGAPPPGIFQKSSSTPSTKTQSALDSAMRNHSASQQRLPPGNMPTQSALQSASRGAPSNLPGRGNLPPGNMPRPRITNMAPDSRLQAALQQQQGEQARLASQQRLPPGNMPTQSALRGAPSNMPTQVAQKVGAAMKETQSRVADYRNKIGQAMGTRASPMPGGPGGGRPMPPVSLPPPVPPKAPQMKSGGKVNIPSPKSDMLYSKKEVNAKNLLSEGKAPNLPHAKGSVNMAKGGMTPKQQAKVGKVMGEFKAGELHSGSKTGPVVKNRKQAVAIGLSEARKAGKK